ncbi:hypothetical protein LT679_08635 [Mucilaginibacter roseus]|uniref:Uncharacterized protein n=1 Tax=Mucilaginibacter roseus TaxID=1528868 RepID=A0ABS8U598_9SPHI|nr:hypothetical protein [Mucilaginibacter roseus]MCD8740663.1 hypothetical protein [Mucilaginibacter roseus]
MNKGTLLIICILTINFCKGQPIPVTAFKIATPPKVNSKEWYKLCSSADNLFSVSIKGGDLTIERGIQKPQREFAFSNGKLIAVNNGEFGGGLYFKPNASFKKDFLINGKEKLLADTTVDTRRKQMFSIDKKADSVTGSVLLVEFGRIRAILPFKDHWLYTEGMAHMGANYGTLHKLHVDGNNFNTQKLFDLNGCPSAMAIHNGIIYIATFQGFYRIRNNKAELILDELFWQGLGVTSIAVKNDKEVYVGISGGYVQIDPDKRKAEFHKYDKL